MLWDLGYDGRREQVRVVGGGERDQGAEHRDARTVPLAEVSDRIAQALRQQKQQALAQEYVQSLKSKGKVEILM